MKNKVFKKSSIIFLGAFFALAFFACKASAATYCMRADGTAPDAAHATGPASDPSKCMNIWVHNISAFSPGDNINVSDAGGVYYITYPNLALGSDPKRCAIDPGFHYVINGTTYNAVAASAGTFPVGSNVPTAKYGAWALDVNSAGTITAVAATDNSTGYDTLALAVTGIPAVAADKARLGTFAIANNSGGNFVPGTTALNASGITTTYTTNPAWAYFTPPSSGTAEGGYITYQSDSGSVPIFDGSLDIRGTGTGSWTYTAPYWRQTGVTVGQTLSTVLWLESGATVGPGFRTTSIGALSNVGDWTVKYPFL